MAVERARQGTRQRVPFYVQEAQAKSAVFQSLKLCFSQTIVSLTAKHLHRRIYYQKKVSQSEPLKELSETDMRLSNGWLHKLTTRHGIQQHMLHVEADSVDRA